MEVKEYFVNKKVCESTLRKNGFIKNASFYSITSNLYKDIIVLTLVIDIESCYLAISVNDDNNNLYAPFYDPDVRENNLVADIVIKNYNNFMDNLVKIKILKHVSKRNNFSGEIIRVKYFSDQIEKLTYIDGKSDWIDLRAAKNISLKKGEFALIPLGVAMELPKGYEAHVVPRSSTFKNFGIIQTNHMGIIDESYCGDGDQWFMPVYATRYTTICKNNRICQFRIIKHQPEIKFCEVKKLGNIDRRGFGSTGK